MPFEYHYLCVEVHIILIAWLSVLEVNLPCTQFNWVFPFWNEPEFVKLDGILGGYSD